MADDRLLLDPINMEAMGFGIFDSAQSVDQGRAALVQAYNSYDWTDETKAKDTLTYYGEQLKYKFKDTSEYSPDWLFQNAPVTLLDMNPQTEEDYENLYSNWEKANLEYLDTNPDPQYAVGKAQFKKDISKAASASRREAFAEDVENTVGETGAAVVDTVNRFAKGALSTVNPGFRQLGVNLNDMMTEITDPELDENFGSQLAEGLGQGAGLITLGRANPKAIAGSVLGQGVDATRDRYTEAKAITGDTGAALKGAAIEGVSQAGQALIDIPLFGKITKAAVGKVAAPVIEGAAKEAVSEGAGQALSNVAENVALGQDPLENVGRGVGRSAVIGGIVAGGYSAAANRLNADGNKVISESNSGIRAQELEEFGATLTPTIKQTIGPVHTTAPEVAAENVEEATETDAPRDLIPEPTTVAFKTDDGAVYLQDEEGHIQKRNTEGGIEQPFDRTAYVDRSALAEIKRTLNEGGQLVAKPEGYPVMVLADGQEIEIPYLENPSEGLYPIQYSEERKPNKDTVLRPMAVGQRIQEVNLDRSLGAASTGATQIRKESAYSVKLRESTTLPPEMRATGEAGIFYDTFQFREYDPDIKADIQGRGLEAVVNDLQNDVIEDPIHRARAETAVHNAFAFEMAEAANVGDTERLTELNRLWSGVAPVISATGSEAGQSLVARKGKTGLNPGKISQVFQEAYQEEISKITDTDPLVVADSDRQAVQLDKDIKRVKDEIKDSLPEGQSVEEHPKMKKLAEEKERVEGLQKQKRKAEKAAAQKVKQYTENQAQVDKLRELIETENLKGATRNKVEREIELREATYEKNPTKRDILYKLWIANNIGSIFGIAVGVVSSGVYAPITKSLGLTASTGSAFLKNLAAGENKYQYPLLKYWAGLADPKAWNRALSLVPGIFKEGTRLENIIPANELVADRAKFYTEDKYQQNIKDYLEYVKNLPPATNPLELLSRGAQLFAGYTSGMLLRTLAAAEAITYTLHDSGFDRAAAAYYYNKNVNKVSEAELQAYKYDPATNWKIAQQSAAYTAKTLKDSGISMSAHDERILATERYQEMRPREVQVDAFKQAAQIVLNAPTPGYSGVAVYHLNQAANDLQIYGAKPLRYLTPFANSIAQFMQLNMDVTPLGFITTASDKGANRTSFERNMAASSAAVGTTLGAALALYAISQIDAEDKWFDIIGKTTQADRDAGVLSNSLRFGSLYVPFGETPFALLFGAAAGVVDKVKEGKEPDMGVFGAISTASFSAANSLLTNMNMLRGIADIYEAVKEGSRNGPAQTGLQVGRTLLNTVKGFVPGAGILRNVSRYYDRPVEARKDIQSAIVEGIPGLQSAYGKPALNVFGEPMLSPHEQGGPMVALHRIFSTKRDDVDIRWLADNGYTIPGQSSIRATKATGDVKLTYEMKYEVFRRAAPEIRSVVGRFRETFGSSAKREAVQDALDKQVNSILAKHKVAVARDQ